MIHTLKFSSYEKRRIARAARICGWKRGESAEFARFMLLEDVATILAAPSAKVIPQTRGRDERHRTTKPTVR